MTSFLHLDVIEAMGTSVVCYAVLLVVPLLGCMSDQDTQVRLLATHCFAQLIQYMPVEVDRCDCSSNIE